MGKVIFSVFFLALLAVSNVADALNVKLVTHNQRSSSGTKSTLSWKSGEGCTPDLGGNYTAPCLNPTLPWNVTNGVTGSNVTWDWNPATQVLTGTGLFWTTSFIGSNSNGTPVISDKVTDLVIDTQNIETHASAYTCVEGTFLAGVEANGCDNTDIGSNGIDETTTTYNVGGVTTCVTSVITGDDYSLLDGTKTPFVRGTPYPRGVTETQAGDAGVGCVRTSGGFDLWDVVSDTTSPAGGEVIISNGICLGTLQVEVACAGANWMTFAVSPQANPDGPFDALQSVDLPIHVMANDTLFTNPVTVTITTAPTKGTATPSAPGPQAGIIVTYQSNAGASGADSFVYTVVDGNGLSGSATVTVNILSGGPNPDSASSHVNFGLNTVVPINVGANDLDFTDPVTITIEDAPDQGGTATPPVAAGPAASATVSYTPAVMPLGTPTYTEHFTYRITDANDLSGTAVVTVTVNNSVPLASTTGKINTISTQALAPLNQQGTFTAPGPGGNLGDAPVVVTATDGVNGTTSEAGSVVTYKITDANFFTGTDNFTFTMTDADGEMSAADVPVTLTDYTPIVTDGQIFTNEGTTSKALTIGITLGNGSLAQHTVSISSQGASGTCTITSTTVQTLPGNGVLGTAVTNVTYTPDPGFTGGDNCLLTALDGDGDSDTGTITITVNAAGGGGGGGGGVQLPGGKSALDLWSLSLLAGAAWLRRRWPSRARRL